MMDVLNNLEKTLSVYFHDKAPKMPQDIQELIVKFGPWLILLSLIISVPSVLGILGLGGLASPYSSLAFKTAGAMYLVIWGLSIVVLVIDAIALPGLFRREMRSWRLIFYGTLISALQGIISFNILGLIIGSAISWYVLFQIKHNYR